MNNEPRPILRMPTHPAWITQMQRSQQVEAIQLDLMARHAPSITAPLGEAHTLLGQILTDASKLLDALDRAGFKVVPK